LQQRLQAELGEDDVVGTFPAALSGDECAVRGRLHPHREQGGDGGDQSVEDHRDAHSALVAGQRSRERAHDIVLTELGLEPLLQLRLRAGEGVGACLAAQLLLTGLRTRATTARVSDR